jgi:hypothetical protein
MPHFVFQMLKVVLLKLPNPAAETSLVDCAKLENQ